jgi:ribosome-associated protein
MIEISPSIQLDENELQFTFVRATGPGGQNVNKVATSAQLRFDVVHSPSLPEDVKQRLVCLGGSRMTTDGVLIIEARRYRTQDQNRTDALHRLITLIQKSTEAPETRYATRPTRASQARRVESKKKRGETKRTRKAGGGDWE